MDTKTVKMDLTKIQKDATQIIVITILVNHFHALTNSPTSPFVRLYVTTMKNVLEGLMKEIVKQILHTK